MSAEFTKTAGGDPLQERLFQAAKRPVPSFSEISHPSVQNRSAFQLIYHVPLLGYATALVIDLVAVQCMRARLNAGRLRDRRGQALYLVGVVLCAAVSAFANVYTTLSSFNASSTGLLPQWMADVAPWFGLVFPSLIVLLSMTAIPWTRLPVSSILKPTARKKASALRCSNINGIC